MFYLFIKFVNITMHNVDKICKNCRILYLFIKMVTIDVHNIEIFDTD